MNRSSTAPALLAVIALSFAPYGCTRAESDPGTLPPSVAPADESPADAGTLDAPVSEDAGVVTCSAVERIAEDAITPAISADGRYVAFTSYNPALVPDDLNGTWDVFVLDRLTKKLERVSVSTNGVEGDGPSGDWSADEPLRISQDGRFVAFSSAATNLVADDTNKTADVFIHDRVLHQTTRVNVSVNGHFVSMSGDGDRVAFLSAAPATAADTNGLTDVYLFTRSSGTTTLVSRTPAGSAGDGDSFREAVSGDGSFVAFLSKAADLATPGPAWLGAPSLYGFDVATGTVELLVEELDEQTPSIDASGRHIAFRSRAALAPGANGEANVYRLDRTTKSITLVSSGDASTVAREPSSDASGGRIAYVEETNVYVRDLADGSVTLVSKGLNGAPVSVFTSQPAISANGACVAFVSVANNLVAGDTNDKADLFIGPAK